MKKHDLAAQVKTLGSDSLLPPISLTRAQADGLRNIRDRGPTAWCSWGSRAGGAISRMFDRMQAQGLCTRPPYKITLAGAQALERFDKRSAPNQSADPSK